MEQFKLIQQPDNKDKQTVIKVINTMLTKAKFKDFFNKNIATLQKSMTITASYYNS